MASLSFASTLLLLFAGAQAATLGGRCGDTDPCASSADNAVGLACDFIAKLPKCAIRVGQSCADNTDKCVSGAECDESKNICNCTVTGYELVRNNTVCKVMDGRVGGHCITFINCGKYTKCALGICTCRDGYRGDYGAAHCVSRGAGVGVSTVNLLLSVVIALFFL